jgi:hypothetical protein
MLRAKGSTQVTHWATVVTVLAMTAAMSRADVVTEKPASIVVFPKVIASLALGLDTVIQITNTSNSMVHARCFYVDARLPEGCPLEDPRIGCTPLWQETDFNIILTRQQPTSWQVSEGRLLENEVETVYHHLYGFGIDPGRVPPVSDGFTGELKCVQVMADGTPVGGNSLKGEATLKTVNDGGEVSKYNAIGILGSELVGGTGNTLLLNRPRDGSRPGQYNACPQALILNHFSEGAPDPFNSDTIFTELTLVPCSQDFERQRPGTVTVQFTIYNEYEERFSASTTVTCWKNFNLYQVDSPNDSSASVFSFARLGTTVAQTRITPTDPANGTFNGAVVGVAEAIRAGQSRAAANIHTIGDRFVGTDGGAFDQIILPDLF